MEQIRFSEFDTTSFAGAVLIVLAIAKAFIHFPPSTFHLPPV